MSNVKVSERRILKDPEWEHTVADLRDLMANYKHAVSVGEQQEFAARAITFVTGNLKRRGIIEP